MFDYLILWGKVGPGIDKKIAEYNLMNLLVKIYNLFMQMPPLSFAELFGGPAEPAP